MKLIHLKKALTEFKHFSARDLFLTRFSLLIVETIITLYDFKLVITIWLDYLREIKEMKISQPPSAAVNRSIYVGSEHSWLRVQAAVTALLINSSQRFCRIKALSTSA